MRTRSLIIMLSLVVIASCKRDKNNGTDACCTTTYPAAPDIPYDTSGMDGVFNYQFLADSTAGNEPAQAAYSAVIRLLTNTARVSANGNTLIQVGNYFSTAFRAVETSSSGVPAEGAWAVKSNDSFSFTYANADTFPAIMILLDDTITNGINNTFYFDADNVSHADTVLLKVFAPTDKGGTNVLSWYTGPTDKVKIPDDVMIALKGKRIRYSISAFNRRLYQYKGFDCIFIKQYTRSGYAWFR